MRGFAPVPFILLLIAAGCASEVQPDHQAEWREVLRHKPAATAPDAMPEQKQLYADAVRTFAEKYPSHDRAREVWIRLKIEFADDLAAAGRYRDAIRIYQSVLSLSPVDDDARRGFAVSADRIAVTREKLLELEKGMSESDVKALLGAPAPGFTAHHRRPEATIHAWYYETRDGGLAGVYFRNGQVFAAEEDASAPLGRLGT